MKTESELKQNKTETTNQPKKQTEKNQAWLLMPQYLCECEEFQIRSLIV